MSDKARQEAIRTSDEREVVSKLVRESVDTLDIKPDRREVFAATAKVSDETAGDGIFNDSGKDEIDDEQKPLVATPAMNHVAVILGSVFMGLMSTAIVMASITGKVIAAALVGAGVSAAGVFVFSAAGISALLIFLAERTWSSHHAKKAIKARIAKNAKARKAAAHSAKK